MATAELNFIFQPYGNYCAIQYFIEWAAADDYWPSTDLYPDGMCVFVRTCDTMCLKRRFALHMIRHVYYEKDLCIIARENMSELIASINYGKFYLSTNNYISSIVQ